MVKVQIDKTTISRKERVKYLTIWVYNYRKTLWLLGMIEKEENIIYLFYLKEE